MDSELAAKVPIGFAKQHRIMPLRRQGDSVLVAMADPLDVGALDDVRGMIAADVMPLLMAFALAFLLAMPWPWVANGLYFFGFTPPGQDYTASGFAATGLFLLWGIYRRGLFHLIPVVHEAVISSMEDGLIVLDTGRRVINFNPAAIELLRTVAAPATNISDSAERTFSPAGLNWPPASPRPPPPRSKSPSARERTGASSTFASRPSATGAGG